jgi:predicted XRE-type DNA-binding protein
MDTKKLRRIKSAGYEVTDSAAWLGLSTPEQEIVSIRVKLAMEVERCRKEQNLTQSDLAKRIGTRQPGVARMVRNPEAATIDSLIKTLLVLGTPSRKIAALF